MGEQTKYNKRGGKINGLELPMDLKELLVQGTWVSEQETGKNGQRELNEIEIMENLQLLVMVMSKL